MLPGEEHWNAVLADILLSRKVGVAHVQLVGDLISVTAQLDMAAQRRQITPGLDAIIELHETMEPLEDAYRVAWRAVETAPDRERRIAELDRLRAALTDAVRGTVDLARRHGLQVELQRFDSPQR